MIDNGAGGFSIWHWLIVIVLFTLTIIPFWKLFKKAGLPPWLALLSPLPPFYLIYLWVLALRK